MQPRDGCSARVYTELSCAESPLFHAQRRLNPSSGDGVEDWVEVSGYEALARARGVAGNLDAARFRT
jgi:hypothetical protein